MTMNVNVPTTPTETRLVLNQLTEVLNALGETDWNGLIAEDTTPADAAQRALTLAAAAGMLQNVATTATQAVSDLMTQVVAASIAATAEGDG